MSLDVSPHGTLATSFLLNFSIKSDKVIEAVGFTILEPEPRRQKLEFACGSLIPQVEALRPLGQTNDFGVAVRASR